MIEKLEKDFALAGVLLFITGITSGVVFVLLWKSLLETLRYL